jgi:hypothetical protein
MLDRPLDRALRSRRSRLPLHQGRGVIVELARNNPGFANLYRLKILALKHSEIFTNLISWRKHAQHSLASLMCPLVYLIGTRPFNQA